LVYDKSFGQENLINIRIEADKAARDFTASIASEYRLSTRKVTLSDVNTDLLKLKKRL
jgi:hypothetical protein